MLIAVFMWASGSIYSRSVKPGGHVVTHIGLQMFIAGCVMMLTSFLIKENHTLQVSTSSLWALAYLVIFGSILAYSAYIYILQHWPLSRVSTYAYVNPVIAVLLGWLVLDEPVTPPVILAMMVILLGVILVQSAQSRSSASRSKAVPDTK
jgi:drug/metabolite transporter (DMT)-like permease